ncbi:hypothetical protein C0J52_25941 [Blattella germanica]|nr:hypothetical protein C0J52_25941 [Blattella germanica]
MHFFFFQALLREIIKDEVDIIECKLTDTNMNKRKLKAWQTIHNRFTELSERERSVKEIKQQWIGMKLEAKKSTFKLQSSSDTNRRWVQTSKPNCRDNRNSSTDSTGI